jgi:hypothetical protein
MKTTWFVLAAAILVSATAASAAERPTAEELLTAFEKSVEKLNRVRIEWSRKGPATDPPEGSIVNGGEEYTLFRDGPRWKMDRLLRMITVEKGNRSESRSREQTLIGDEIIHVMQVERPPGDQPHTPIVSCKRGDGIAARSFREAGPFGFLFGRLWGDAGYPLWTIMREAGSLELLPETETVGGVETYVLKSVGKYGEHQVWLDPASGGLPRRIEVHKRPGHLLDSEQLGTSPAPDPNKPIKFSLRIFRTYSCRIDKIQIADRDGVFIMTEFESEENSELTTGKTRVEKIERKFRVLDINPKEFPENAFRFDIEIPNGTPVWVTENDSRKPTRFEWVDGKIRERAGK